MILYEFLIIAISISVVCLLSLKGSKAFEKGLITLSGCVLILLSLVVMVTVLGKPKPLRWEFFRTVDRVTVISHAIKEGSYIALWVRFDDDNPPVSYIIPWDTKKAKKFLKKLREAKRSNQRLKVSLPRFNFSFKQREIKFYTPPRPKRFNKEYRSKDGGIYEFTPPRE